MGTGSLGVRWGGVAVVAVILFLCFPTTPASAQSGPCTSATSVCITTWQQDTNVSGVCNGCSYRTGLNLSESSLVAGNLNTFGKLCSEQLDGQIYAQPLVATGVTIGSMKYTSVVYVVTENDTLYAIDGDPTDGNPPCSVIQSLSFLSTGATSGQYPVDCTWVGDGTVSCNSTIGPYVGILGTPVMTTDGTSGTIYLVTETQDVNPLPNHPKPGNWYHYLHAVDIQSLTETVPAVQISPPNGTGSKFSQAHIQRSALLYLAASQARLSNPMVYVAFSMMDGTAMPYPNGAIFGFNAANLAAPPLYFQTSKGTTGADGGGIWMGGGGPAYGTDKNGVGWIYLTTANGAWDGSTNWGDSFLMLDPSSLTVANNNAGYLTPVDQFYRSSSTCNAPPQLNGGDVDFGSGSVMLVPDGELANWPNLAINGDKEGGLWMIDRTNPGGHNPSCDQSQDRCLCTPSGNASGNIQTFWTGTAYSGHVIHNGLAFWRRQPQTQINAHYHYLYVIPSGGGVLTQYQLCGLSSAQSPLCNAAGVLAKDFKGNQVKFGYGSTPTISAASATATSAILWETVPSKDPQPKGTAGGGTMYAFDAVTMRMLYSNHTCSTRDALSPTVKFSIPTVANGNLYLGA